MSEYQYYEWQSIDRPLTATEQSAVDRLSSHIEATATGARVQYHWSDFKHDPLQVLTHYFDAFLYYANWGSKRLAFRFPRDVVDEGALQPYLWHDCIDTVSAGEWFVLVFDAANADGNWFEGEAHLSTFAPLRNDILAGDFRVLYLAWLLGAAASGIDEELEPPVPAGLGKLSAPLAEYCAFFEIDPHLLQAAAEASPSLQPAPQPPVDELILRMSRAECEAFLRRLAVNEPLLALKFNRRLAELAGSVPAAVGSTTRRTWGELRERTETLRQAETQRKAVAAEAARVRRLEALALREAEAWNEVHALIERKQAQPYDQAVSLLCELRDLALYRHEAPEFKAQVARIREKYAKRPGLLARMEAAGLA